MASELFSSPHHCPGTVSSGLLWAHLSKTVVLGLSLGFGRSAALGAKATPSCCGSRSAAVSGLKALLKADSKFLCLHRAPPPSGRLLRGKVVVVVWKLWNEAGELGLVFSMSGGADEGSSSWCSRPHRTAAAVAACQLSRRKESLGDL